LPRKVRNQGLHTLFSYLLRALSHNYLLYSFSVDKGSLHDSSTTQHSPTSLFGGKGTNIINKCICDK